VIPSASASNPAPATPQRRVLHLWTNGFSIEDGPLHRFDDPQNAADLAVIRSGRAPIHLMNVAYDQPVDVQLNKHDEDYVKPKSVYKPFSGGGQRLGSPVPGAEVVSAPMTTVPPSGAAEAVQQAPQVDVDASLPAISLRIQLADGTRLPARFNTTHTIGDVYDFIARASPGSAARAWVLATTFPNKEHTDKGAVLGEVAEFKRGGTAVQKWV
jgi:UBX domain-containing protein 1